MLDRPACRAFSPLRGLLGALCASGLMLAACSSSEKPAVSRQLLSVADFSDPAASATVAAPVHVEAPVTLATANSAPAASTMNLSDVSISPGPAKPVEGATATGAGAEVDAKVGDINGRAIFASSFLEEMGARLRAQGQDLIKRDGHSIAKSSPAQIAGMKASLLPIWQRSAQYLIRQKLDNELQVELLRAEAASSFTTEQRMGFLAFLQKVQKDLYSESGGSATKAGELVSEQEGKTIDDYLKQRKTLELVRFQLQRKVFSRVNISWRDIELDYDRRPEAYIEPPKATFRVILVKTEDDAKAFEQRLAAGEAFEEVAKAPSNIYKREQGGLEERQLAGKQSEAKLFGPASLNAAAQKLTEGEWAGPFKLDDTFGFVFLEHIHMDTRTLYDVQLRVEDALRTRRQELETTRYIERLKARASFSNLDEMTEKLLQFAQKRYFEPLFTE